MVNTTAAIIAIPEALDPIRLIGKEEKHSTLLFFGETSTLPDNAKQTLLDSVEQACKMLFPFREEVIDISRLGSDTPPALVAKLSNSNIGPVRNLFSMNPSVKGYLDNTAQFPSFKPHVTLDYPDYTDEAILRVLVKSVYQVKFDRLAVWWNDERIDFSLDMLEGGVASMSDVVDEFLAQSGVKGMHWGVRNQSSGASVATSSSTTTQTKSQRASVGAALVKTVKKDKEYWHKSSAVLGVSAVGLAAAALAPALLPASVVAAAGGTAVVGGKIALGVGLTTRAAYYHQVYNYRQRARTARLSVQHADIPKEKTVGEVYDELTPDKKLAANLLIEAYSKNVEFADDLDVQSGWASMTPTERSVVLFFASGTNFEDVIVHADPIDAALEHSGIKGMKWGVRNPVNASTGLVKRTSSEDQIHVDRITKKVRGGGVGALSNKDLQDYATRVQRENEFNRAHAAAMAKSDGFIKGFLKSQGKRQFNRVADKAIDLAVEKTLLKAGIKFEAKGKKGLAGDLTEIAGRLQPKKKKGGSGP